MQDRDRCRNILADIDGGGKHMKRKITTPKSTHKKNKWFLSLKLLWKIHKENMNSLTHSSRDLAWRMSPEANTSHYLIRRDTITSHRRFKEIINLLHYAIKINALYFFPWCIFILTFFFPFLFVIDVVVDFLVDGYRHVVIVIFIIIIITFTIYVIAVVQ